MRSDKGVDEMIDECLFRRFCHVKRMENNSIARRVYIDVCDDSRSVGSPRER